jgi:hypothetical protein
MIFTEHEAFYRSGHPGNRETPELVSGFLRRMARCSRGSAAASPQKAVGVKHRYRGVGMLLIKIRRLVGIYHLSTNIEAAVYLLPHNQA